MIFFSFSKPDNFLKTFLQKRLFPKAVSKQNYKIALQKWILWSFSKAEDFSFAKTFGVTCCELKIEKNQINFFFSRSMF